MMTVTMSRWINVVDDYISYRLMWMSPTHLAITRFYQAMYDGLVL
jgi:hypothetical protein